ncbi:MAG: hypothetical protein JW769_04585 [Parachlamydiales bacterium]|nr:hypothetical protein [Parachlamydiales bacterium]
MLRKIVCLFLYCSFVYAQSPEIEENQDNLDMEALQKWIREKRMITVKEIGGDLSLSGEVRAEMQVTSEKKGGIQQRGSGLNYISPMVAFDSEVNLMLDYRGERTWASIKLEFDNNMGLKDGTTNRIAVEKAYLGGRLYDGETFSVEGAIGRRFLGNVFDSKIQFNSIYDGVLLRLNKASEQVGDFYVNLGSFIVSEKTYHYGYVGEMGLLNIANTGFFTKYSFISWKKHYTDELKKLRYSFGNSQVILGYQCTPVRWDKYIKGYVGGLINHFAKKIPLTDHKRQNYAWYAGVSVGQVQQKGDWALDVNYQFVAPQAVSDYDAVGIRRGNAEGVGFYTMNIDGTGGPTDRSNAVGNANYKGICIEFLYAFTSNITILQNFQHSTNENKSLGPNFKYNQYEVEFIYAF